MTPALWLVVAALAAPVQAPLTVSAAVSLTEALTAIAKHYGPVRFNFAASNVLARQIVNGAPVDLFISADDAQMDVVARAGRIDTATRSELVQNFLAVVVRGGATTAVRQPRDLTHPEIRRIAVGNPEAVPAGVYARTWLQSVGVWDAIATKIVPVGSVRAALAAVESGSVDAAVVYHSDTSRVQNAAVAFVVRAGAPRISYPAAVIAGTSRRDEALRFLAFLRGNRTARKIFTDHGFTAVEVR